MTASIAFTLGLILGVALMLALAARLSRRRRASGSPTDAAQAKLATARRYLAMIVARDTIGEAVRIAKKAIREIDA